MERMKHLERELEKSVGEIIIDLQREIRELEEENKKLKEEKEIRALNDRDNLIQIEKLEKENKKLKGENEYRKTIVDVVPEGEGHIAEETIQDLQEEIKKLKEELKKYKKLHKYSNGELQTYSGD